jgi:hypothetical protein
MHQRRLSSEALRSNGLSPKTVDWRQPEPLGFYANDAGALPQLDVRKSVTRPLLTLVDADTHRTMLRKCNRQESIRGSGIKAVNCKVSQRVFPQLYAWLIRLQWIKLTARYSAS